MSPVFTQSQPNIFETVLAAVLFPVPDSPSIAIIKRAPPYLILFNKDIPLFADLYLHFNYNIMLLEFNKM